MWKWLVALMALGCAGAADDAAESCPDLEPADEYLCCEADLRHLADEQCFVDEGERSAWERARGAAVRAGHCRSQHEGCD